jgi:hypothetical protein
LLLHISEGIYGNATNRNPQFKSLEQFDAAIRELIGSIDHEVLNEALNVLVVDVKYLNRFYEIVTSQVDEGIAELSEFLDLDIPLSVQSITSVKPSKEQIEFLVQSLASLAGNQNLGIETTQLGAISNSLNSLRDFMVLWMDEMQRSMKYIEEFRGR